MWWLGEPAAYAFALANLDLMIVRPCLGQDREPIVVGMLEAGRAQGAARQRIARPARPVRGAVSRDALAQSQMGRRGLVPAAVVLRCFVIAEGDGYRVLPGGLAREPAGDTALRSLGRLNGTLKDVWVLAEDAADVQIPPTGASTSSPSSAAAPTCKAGSPTISTGSAATSSAWTTMPACCAPRRPRWRRA